MQSFGQIVEQGPHTVTAHDSFTCNHCQGIVAVPHRGRPEDIGGLCKLCMKLVCPRCNALGKCTPWEKQMQIIEARDAARRSYLLSALLLLTCLAWCVPARAAIAITDTVQQANFANIANGTAVVTLTHSTALNDLIIVGGCPINGWNAAPITDSGSQAYTQVFTADIAQNGSTTTCRVYYFAGSAAGITTVTGKESAGAGQGTMWVLHATGMATSSPVDQFATFNVGSSSPWSSTATSTTTNANDLLIGLMVGVRVAANSVPSVSGSWSIGGSVSSGAGWDGNNGNAGMVGTQIVAATGAYQFTGTDTGGANVTDRSSIVAFKGAAAATGTNAWIPSGPSFAIMWAGMVFGITLGAWNVQRRPVFDAHGFYLAGNCTRQLAPESISLADWLAPSTKELVVVPSRPAWSQTIEPLEKEN